MKADSSFVEFVLDQLAGIPRLMSKRMFGAVGLYADGTFFAIIDEGRLYFKTVADTRQPYLDAGMSPFCPDGKTVMKQYYEVPVEVLEDEDALTAWAKDAIRAGQSPRS